IVGSLPVCSMLPAKPTLGAVGHSPDGAQLFQQSYALRLLQYTPPWSKRMRCGRRMLSNERYHALPTTSTSGLQLVAKGLDDVGPVHLDGGNRAMVPRLTYHEFTDAGVLQEQHRYRLLMCQHNDELGIGHRIHINILERGLRLTAGGILGGADLTLDEDEV